MFTTTLQLAQQIVNHLYLVLPKRIPDAQSPTHHFESFFFLAKYDLYPFFGFFQA